MKIRRSTVFIGAGALVTAAAVIGGLRSAHRLPFFRVREVEVVGTHYLDESDVVQRLGLVSTTSTFDRLDRIRAAAAAIPGVVGATVERRLPGTLRVTLREAIPVAVAPLADRVVLVDSRGHVLPFDPLRVPVSLPIAGTDPATDALLGRLMLADPLLYATVESAHLDHGDVVLEAGPHRIRFRPEAGDEVIRGVAAVCSYLAANNVPWREIDARYHARVFVRRGTA